MLTIVDRTADGVEVIDNWNGFGQRTTSSGTVKLQHVEVDPLLIFDERLLGNQPSYRGAYFCRSRKSKLIVSLDSGQLPCLKNMAAQKCLAIP